MRSLNIIRGSALSSINLFLQIAIAFFLTPMMIRSLGDRYYGIWILLSTLIGYYGILDLGISGAVQRFISRAIGAEEHSEKKYICSTAFYLFGSIGVAILLVTIAIAICAPRFVAESEDILLIRQVLIILGVGVGLTFPFRIFTGILNANLRFDICRYIEIGVVVVRTSVIVVILLNHGTLFLLAFVSVAATLSDYLLKFIFAFRIDSDISISTRYFSPARLKKVFCYSAYTCIAQVAKMLSERSGPIIIAKIISATAVTQYSVAYSFINYFMQLIWSVIGVIGPVFSQDEGKNAGRAIVDNFIFSVNLCVYVAFFCGSMSVLYGDRFIGRWLGASYSDVYSYLVIFMIPMTINLSLAPIYYLLNNISRHRILSMIQILEGAFTLIFSIILGKKYGVYGVVWGYAIPLFFFSVFVRPVVACRSIDLSVLSFLRKYLKNLFIASIFMFPLWYFLDTIVTESYTSLLGAVFVHALVFFCGCFLLGLDVKNKLLILQSFSFAKKNC